MAGIYNGADIEGMEDGIDKGLWGHPLIDQSTIRVASLFAPLGPWASSKSFGYLQIHLTDDLMQ